MIAQRKVLYLDKSYFCRSPDTLHEVQKVALSIPKKPKTVELAVQNATGGVYVLQSSFHRKNQLQYDTSDTVRWDADPSQALSQLQPTASATCRMVGIKDLNAVKQAQENPMY